MCIGILTLCRRSTMQSKWIFLSTFARFERDHASFLAQTIIISASCPRLSELQQLCLRFPLDPHDMNSTGHSWYLQTCIRTCRFLRLADAYVPQFKISSDSCTGPGYIVLSPSSLSPSVKVQHARHTVSVSHCVVLSDSMAGCFGSALTSQAILAVSK